MAEDEDENVNLDTISQIVQGDENSSEEKQENATLSKDEPNEINEPKSLSSDEPKNSGTTVAPSESKKIVEKSEKYRKPINFSDDPEVQRIVDFLRSKDLSENLIGRILKNDICEGFDRLLRALGITNEEMMKFEWKKRFDSNDFAYDSSEPEVVDFSESSMSPDNLYLKKHFGDTLVRAMKDIVKVKPKDPVDFLGNWLINYKVSEERKNKCNEFEAELMVQRESSKIPEMDMQSEVTGYDGTDKLVEDDFIYGEYDEPG